MLCKKHMLNTKDGKLLRVTVEHWGKGQLVLSKSKGIMKRALLVLLFFLYYFPNPNKLEKKYVGKSKP